MRPCLIAILVFFFLFMPSSIGARIIPDACIGGIGLFDTSTRVLAEWGKPLRKKRIGGQEGTEVVWIYRNGSVTLTFDHTAATRAKTIVVGIGTTDPRQRTPAGIGPGSTLKQVKAAYRRIFCGQGWCAIETGTTDIYTELRLRGGRVVAVSMSMFTNFDRSGQPDPRCKMS